jgi:HlyB family type I secretion system ABC transporter
MDTESLDAVLQSLPVLTGLPHDVRDIVIASFVPASYTFGQAIVYEGDASDALYVLVSGRVRMVKRGENGDEISLGALRPGETFGEGGLSDHTVHPATVRASGDVEVVRLDRSVFEALLRRRPEVRKFFELQSRHRNLQFFFRQFTVFAKLPPEVLNDLLANLEPIEFRQGDVVIREGEPPGPMYIIEEGRCRIHIGVDGRRRNVAFLRRGEFFGELSVLRDQPRDSTVEAVTNCRLLRLTQQTYQELLEQHQAFRDEIEGRIAQYDFMHTAAIPIDLFREMLPAEASVLSKVGDDQIDQDLTRMWAIPPRPETPAEQEAPPPTAAPVLTSEFAPFADQEGRFVKRKKRMRKFPHVWQIDEMDCGAASLAIVCRHFGKAVSLARIRQLSHTSLDGTSLRAICQAATELGLAARAVKASSVNLDQMPLPAVVHWDGNHWVVLYDVDEKYVRVSDPAKGRVILPRADFAQKWSGYAALFDYTAEFEKNKDSKLGIGWLLAFFKPHKTLILQATALAVIVSALQMVIPVFTQVIVDRVLVERDLGLLNILIAGMAGVVIFTLIATVIQRYLLSFTAVRIDSATLDYLTRRLLSLPMSYFNTRRTGDIQRRLQGIWLVREFMVEHGVAGLTAVAQLLVSLALMLVYSPLLTLTFLSTVPLFALLMRYSSTWLFPLYSELEESHGKYQSFQIDAIKGIETVKAMGAEVTFRETMLAQFHRIARRQFRADFTIMVYEGAVGMVAFLTTALFLWVGARQVLAGHLTIGALVAFNALVALANVPITTLLNLWDNFQLATVLLGRLDDVFQQEPEQGRERRRLQPVRTLEGRIGLRGVGFRYGGPESPAILDGITLEVPPGRMVAIVGRSGSGKTTLVKCLAGLLEPTDGTILYDGVDLKTLNYRDLRRQIGFVLQENHLFDDTIARNIAFGEGEPDMDRVMWAARVANAHEFVERLPLGYETRVGESGLAISGGQRQRIAIARAVYHQPPVLILDEATSSLDSESERAVKENIDRLLEGRTSFVIAHRLSTVRDADLIVVLERGRLVEQGSHDDLLKRQGLYFYLVSQQLAM